MKGLVSTYTVVLLFYLFDAIFANSIICYNFGSSFHPRTLLSKLSFYIAE